MKIHGILLACFFAVTAHAAEPSLVFREGMVEHPSLKKSPTTFLEYTKDYATPVLFDDNEVALKARLKLLDNVPDGGEAKIMTFLFDNGYASRLLASHMCLAAKRGVKVQFTADSKSGDRPGVIDAFDKKGHMQVNEEVYQLLINCGVEVRIHNHIEEFDILKFKGIPVPKLPESYTSLLSDRAGQLRALSKLKSAFTEVAEEQFNRYFDTDQAKEEFKDLNKSHNTLMKTAAISALQADSPEDMAKGLIESLDELKDIADNSKSLAKLDPKRIKMFMLRLIVSLQKHEVMGPFFRNAHVFNRLNHRKLFWVSSGGRSCMFMGGRNLGDHYLTWGRHGDEFMDGDVLLCNHGLGDKDGNPLDEAKESFAQIWDNSDQEDPLDVPNKQTTQKPNLKYKFKYLLLPDYSIKGWGNPMWIYMPFNAQNNQWTVIDWRQSQSSGYEDLKEEDRLMPFPILWDSSTPIAGKPIEDAYGWHVRKTIWNHRKDEVRKDLYAAIDRETELVYIETAYSSMKTDFREHIEAALKRGVKVELVTNSIFVSDGGSKAIRLLMANWTSQMLKKYKGLFTARFATLEYGHMIHFKGASFKCQKDNTGVYRYNLIGSHNFHQRSGYSDKEHALFWKQPVQSSCAKKMGVAQVSNKPDLKDMRDGFYSELSQKVAPLKPLKPYINLEDEFQDGLSSGKLSGVEKHVVKWATYVLYSHDKQNDGSYVLTRDPMTNAAVLRAQNNFVEFLEALSETGLGDIFGSLL